MSDAKGVVLQRLEHVELACPDPKCGGKFRADLSVKPTSIVHTMPLCEAWKTLEPADYLRLAGFDVINN